MVQEKSFLFDQGAIQNTKFTPGYFQTEKVINLS